YFGWRAAAISGVMAGTLRMILGGPGALTGTLVILMASSMGLLFRRWVDPVKQKATLVQTLALALSTHAGMFVLLVILLPLEAQAFIFEYMLIPIFVFYPLATLLVGRILMDQQVRVRTVASLKASEARFRNLFEHSQVIMLLIDPGTGRIVDANAAASRYYGWPIDQLRCMKMSDIHSALSTTLSGDGNSDYTRRTENALQLKHHLANGQTRDVDVYSSPIQENDRICLCLMVFDVFQREESEHKLRVALQEKELVLQTALSGYQLLDVEGRILEVNEAICKMTGYSREELLGMMVTEFTPDEDPESIKDTIQTIQDQGGSRFEKRAWAKDGRMILFDISTRAIRIEGDVRICAFYRDITGIREQEKLMRLHSAALQAAANRVVITDVDGKIEWANRAFSEGSGYRLDEVIGKEPGELLKSGIQDSDFYRAMWGTIQQGDTWRGEVTNRHKDGHFYQEDLTITPLFDTEGTITRLYRDQTGYHR
ncbi:MAG: PAS domain S-box protein, partial [Kiritimatiellae bacterium]|nr:PAS domain S-box protein [Kiritimatiellia bacterium]